MSNAGSDAAEATKYAADKAAESAKYTADAQKDATEHEADLLFKTEQADREQDEKYRKEDLADEKQMMSMFDMLDETMSDQSTSTDRRGSRRVGGSEGAGGPSDDYNYPDPSGLSDDEMSFS
ncbi:MAG: hypothetical protein U1F57_06260 [bacterium]